MTLRLGSHAFEAMSLYVTVWTDVRFPKQVKVFCKILVKCDPIGLKVNRLFFFIPASLTLAIGQGFSFPSRIILCRHRFRMLLSAIFGVLCTISS
uniref:Uncharacterized protein n=1 Tax=Arundo donax TaxID=35708 RepID=A0A0A9D4R7_ARUDO